MITMLALLVRARWTALLVTGLLSAVLGGLAAAGAVYPQRTGDRLAAEEVATAPITERSFMLTPAQGDNRGDNTTQLETQLEGVRKIDGFTAYLSAQLQVMGFLPGPTGLLYREDFCTHIRLLSGRCPVSAGEVAIPADDAKRTKTIVGSQLDISEAIYDQRLGWLPSPEGSHPFDVVGVYAPLDQTEIYWGAANPFRTELDGSLTAPMLTQADSLNAVPHQNELITADAIASPQMLAGSTFADVSRSLLDHLVDPPEDGIPDLMARVQARRQYVAVMTPAVVVPVIALGCLVLFLLVSRRVQRERTELGVQSVRGLPLALRWWIAAAPTALAALAGVAVGAVIGGSPVNPLVGFAALAGLIAVTLAVLPVVTARPVDALRQVGPSWAARVRGLPLGELALAAVAIAAVALARTGDEQGLGIYAPALLAGAVALVAVRVLPGVLRGIARWALGSGRLVTGLAAAQLARRPSARPLIALTSLAVALLALVAGANDAAQEVRTTQAAFAIGADRVLTVRAYAPGQVLAAVRAMDPDGRYAVAVGKVTGSEDVPTVLAVDLTRARLLSWTPPAGLVSPSSSEPLLSGAVTVRLSLTGASPAVSLVVTDPAGERHTVELPTVHPGVQELSVKLPSACSAGCELSALVAHGRADADAFLSLASIGGIADLPQWTVFGSTDGGGNWPVGGQKGRPDTWLLPPDAPTALPVAATPGLSLEARAFALPGPGGSPPGVRVKEVASVEVLPRLGTRGVLADFGTLARATAGAQMIDTMEVWLTAAAPPDVVSRLTSLGVQVASSETRAQAIARAGQTPQAMTLRLHLIATAVAWLLVAAVLLAVARLDRGSNDINALRFAGVPASMLRRAARAAYAATVLVGVVIGSVSAAIAWALVRDALPISDGSSWIAPPAFPHFAAVAVPVGGAALALIVVSWLAFLRPRLSRDVKQVVYAYHRGKYGGTKLTSRR